MRVEISQSRQSASFLLIAFAIQCRARARGFPTPPRRARSEGTATTPTAAGSLRRARPSARRCRLHGGRRPGCPRSSTFGKPRDRLRATSSHAVDDHRCAGGEPERLRLPLRTGATDGGPRPRRGRRADEEPEAGDPDEPDHAELPHPVDRGSDSESDERRRRAPRPSSAPRLRPSRPPTAEPRPARNAPPRSTRPTSPSSPSVSRYSECALRTK